MCDIILLITDISYVFNLKGQIIELLHSTLVIYISNQKVRIIMRDLAEVGFEWNTYKYYYSYIE